MAPFMQGVLLDLYKAWAVVPSEWALIGLCIYCACTFQELRRNFLAHFWTTFIYAFGGGMTTALLMMRPDKAPISILSDSKLGLQWAAVWWIMNYFPYQIPAKLHNLWPVKMLTLMCVAFCKDKLIIDRVNLACDLYPGTIVGPIILGTLAGCGGTIVTDSIRHAQGILRRPHELNVPSFSWRSAFLCSVFYFFSAKYPLTSFLLPEEAAAILLTLLVSHVMCAAVIGMDLDWTQPIINLGLTLLNIPIPRAGPSAPASKPKAAASEPAKTAAAPAPAQAAPAKAPASNKASSAAQQNGKPAAAVNKAVNGTAKPAKEAAPATKAPAKEKAKVSDDEDDDELVLVAKPVAPAEPAKKSTKAKKEKPAPVQPGWTQVTHRPKKA